MHKTLTARLFAAVASVTLTLALLDGVARLAEPDAGVALMAHVATARA